MTATKSSDRDFDLQVLSDMLPGHFKGKTAFMGSNLAASRAVAVSPTFPGTNVGLGTVTVPRFGVIGAFADNPEDTAAAAAAVLKSTNEQATPARSSLFFEVTKWSQLESTPDMDPYTEAKRQIELAAQREMDRIIVSKAAATPLVKDVYSSSAFRFLDWDLLMDGFAKWGDEEEDAAALIVHSSVHNALRKQRDAQDRLLLLPEMVNGREVLRWGGITVQKSNSLPLTSSTMGAVTSAGTTPPVATLTGTPLDAFNLRIEVVSGTAHETATIRFSTDGGGTWSAALTTLAATEPLLLTDTATDSLVGVNGATGISVAFAAGTFHSTNVWTATALLKATSLLVQPGALAFWFNADALKLQFDHDITKDNDLGAMHLYYAAHLYKRRAGSNYPGVVAIKHNVENYVGVV